MCINLGSIKFNLSQDCVSLSYCYQWKNTQQQTERNYFSKNLKTHKLILKSISRTANLARGSVQASKIRWAHGKNYSTQISNQGAQAQAQAQARAKRAPWVRKFGNLCIRYLHPRNNDSLVIVRLLDRPTVNTTGIPVRNYSITIQVWQLEVILAGNRIDTRVLWSRDN